MKITPTAIPDVLVLEPQVFGDVRGFFFESWSRRVFEAAVGRPVEFVQDNHSRSAKAVLRGLHWQAEPHAQGKLVRVVRGGVFDVAVDIRPQSPTFKRWVGVELSEENKLQMWIPPGLAHGFLVLSDSADFLYKATAYYAPGSERALRWDDPEIGIEWPSIDRPPALSQKDATAPSFMEAVSAQVRSAARP
ncbi:MAG TPA: dTDP-4-dehydrorhamnose 3,5-epimerase [Caldimonas sp.]|nr:dTDP-4-dehydrorhamnose 3,5-epimerase [Caldimonas sp.]